jgi:hypothetical protein
VQRVQDLASRRFAPDSFAILRLSDANVYLGRKDSRPPVFHVKHWTAFPRGPIIRERVFSGFDVEQAKVGVRA